MSTIARVAAMKDAEHFRAHLRTLGISIPCDDHVTAGVESPLSRELVLGDIRIGNRIAVQPMEGWDGTADGNPSQSTVRRWRRFGQSGAKLIWGGEAVAVCHAGRANPNQLVIAVHTQKGLHQLRTALIEEHRLTTGSDNGLLIGLQLTHSGRFCRPNRKDRAEPRILYRHPILDRRMGLAADYPLLTDSEIQSIIEDFVRVAQIVRELGFDFVDIKHCHGYLGHEFLSAREREGQYGGSFENRTGFLKHIVESIRTDAPGLEIGVRLSAFDLIPFRPDPEQSLNGKPGPGIPEDAALPYRSGFGVNESRPSEPDLNEPERFIALLQDLGIRLVNITGGSPYYNPHVQRPALYPPSDGYLPPEDPLVGVARQMGVTRELKRKFPKMVFVGSAYSYLQDFLAHVAQAAIREGWVDSVGLGRMVLSYPEVLWDAINGTPMQRKRICRTFSDCTTAPRNGLPSGCYPLDAYYKDSEDGARLKAVKAQAEGRQPALTNAAAVRKAQMEIKELLTKKKPGRKVRGIAAALLPYAENGKVAVEAFQRHLAATHRTGLMNAVNMDTGYVNYLADSEMEQVLGWTREALGQGVPFVAGAYIEGRSGDLVTLYRREMDQIVSFGGIPILFQTARLHGKSASEKLAAYRDICKGYDQVLGFELGLVFAPNGEIFDDEVIKGLLDIPEMKGIKHSSLDRPTELRRLALRDARRPDFAIYTGNDLGIDMIEYGSDYLLGLATFAPEKFAERDRLWQSGDPAYYGLSDALQYLGNIAFRAPVPAYKHSAAVFLHLTGRIPSDLPHPRTPRRPSWEAEILRDCAARLGILESAVAVKEYAVRGS